MEKRPAQYGLDLLLWIINNVKPWLLLLLHRHDKANSASSSFFWTGGRRPDIHMWCLLLSAIVSLSLNPYPELISIIVDICHLPSLLITFATFASFSGSLDQWVLWFRLWIAKLRNAQIGVKLCKSFCLFQARWLWGVQRGVKVVKHCSHFVAPMLMMTVMLFRVPLSP